jgi:hypothetical protein
MGDDVGDPPPVTARGSRWTTPFAIFGYVAVAAAAGAIGEAMYYTTSPALSAASLPTTLGIVLAVVVFVVVGLLAPPND